MDNGKKTTVYLPKELSEALRLLAFQMYTTVSDLLTVAAEEKFRALIAEGADTNFGPKQPSPQWQETRDLMTRRRQARSWARRARRDAREEHSIETGRGAAEPA